MKTKRVIIIGAGPAGIAAGVQLKRCGIDPVIFEKNRIGGLLRNANLIENYPGFPNGIRGIALSKLMEKQASEFSLDIRFCEVESVDFADGSFEVKTNAGKYYSKILLVSSGTRPVMFDDFEIYEQAADRVHYEIECLLEEKGKRFVIIGAGDAAFDYALGLHESNEVVIINRGEDACCLPLLKSRAERIERISYRKNTRITAVEKTGKGIDIDFQNHSESGRVNADYLVFAIGREPETGYFTENLSNNMRRLADEGLLYFAGDVINGHYRQTAVAVGDGVKAAMMISAKLESLKCV